MAFFSAVKLIPFCPHFANNEREGYLCIGGDNASREVNAT